MTAAAPTEDKHWFQPDDFVVNGGGVSIFSLAKMLTAPTDQSKGEGEFMTMGGKRLWSANFARTRPATQADLKVGQRAFIPDGCNVPADKNSSRSTRWGSVVITDTSDLFKGSVTVSWDGYVFPCNAGWIRVPISGSPTESVGDLTIQRS